MNILHYFSSLTQLDQSVTFLMETDGHQPEYLAKISLHTLSVFIPHVPLGYRWGLPLSSSNKFRQVRDE